MEKGLRDLGFTIVNKPVSNLYVQFSGTVAQVTAAFQVSQDLYAYNGKVLRANAQEPTLPASLKGVVTAISGLDDSGLLIHPFHRSINDDSVTTASAQTTTR